MPTAADDRALAPGRPGILVPQREGMRGFAAVSHTATAPTHREKERQTLELAESASRRPDPPHPPKQSSAAPEVLAVPHPPVEARFGNPIEVPIPGGRASHAMTTGGKAAGVLLTPSTLGHKSQNFCPQPSDINPESPTLNSGPTASGFDLSPSTLKPNFKL